MDAALAAFGFGVVSVFQQPATMMLAMPDPLKGLTTERVFTEDRLKQIRKAYKRHADAQSKKLLDGVVESVQVSVQKAIESGKKDWRGVVNNALNRAGVSVKHPHRLVASLERVVGQAYGDAQWDVLQQPGIKERFPKLAFWNPNDKKTSSICKARVRICLPSSHSWWRRNWPPLHYACRSRVLFLDATTAGGQRTKRPGRSSKKDERVQKGFGRPMKLPPLTKKAKQLELDFSRADPKKFVSRVDKLPGRLKPYVTRYTPKQYEQKGIQLFLSDNSLSGYGIASDGDLISVFSLPGAHQGGRAVESAKKNGATKLDCFDGKLPGFYNQYGFVEYKRLKWDDKFAPSGWNRKKRGRPDVVFMRIKRGVGKKRRKKK